MIEQNDIMESFLRHYKESGVGVDKFSASSMTLGVVVNTDDPLQNGRLQIFCPALNDDPSKPTALPWAVYVSPFGGSINNSAYLRGAQESNARSVGSVHYGFWAIPELGANVLVGCIDGDPRRRYWIGCIPSHQETHTLFNGRFENTGGGTIDGPLSSDLDPIEPLYSNLSHAFPDRSSHEWKTRGADYQPTSVRRDLNQTPNSERGDSYLDDTYTEFTRNELYTWIHEALGEHGYDWTGFSNIGSMRASRTYGMTTPGMHSLMMDDRHFNSRIKLRSGAGHSIILDDTNERIYIMTELGNSFIELDSNGNIDIYSARRLSIHAEKDINFTTDETFRVTAKKGIHLYAGDNQSQAPLDSPPSDGEIRIQSEHDLHLISEKNTRMFSKEGAYVEIGGDKCETIGGSSFLQVQNDINVITNDGDYNLSVSGDYNLMVRDTASIFSVQGLRLATSGTMEMFSYGGSTSFGSQGTISFKSMGGDILLEAVGSNSDTSGGVFIRAPQTQAGFSNRGLTLSSNSPVAIGSSSGVSVAAGPSVSTPQTPPLTPPSAPIGPCNLGPGPLPTEGYTGADLVARLAYNAGFRGDALVIAVAVARGESNYNLNALGDTTLTTPKWGPSYGLWQIRSLNNPSAYSFPDTLRLNDGFTLFQGDKNAEAAYAISKQGTNWRPWTVFTAGIYLQYMPEATAAVQAMCNPLFTTTFQNDPMVFSSIGSNLLGSVIDGFSPVNTLSSANVISLGGTGMTLQSITDLNIKTLFNGYSQGFGSLTSTVNIIADVVSNLPGASFIPQLPNLNLNITTPSLPNLAFPDFGGGVDSAFYYLNHDALFGGF